MYESLVRHLRAKQIVHAIPMTTFEESVLKNHFDSDPEGSLTLTPESKKQSSLNPWIFCGVLFCALAVTPVRTAVGKTIVYKSVSGSSAIYADVWDWVAPKGRIINRAFVMNDGRVWVAYSLIKDVGRPDKFEYVEFFSKRKLQGSKLPPGDVKPRVDEALLPSGTIFSSRYIRGWRAEAFGSCYQGINGVVDKRRVGVQKPESKMLLYLFDKPQRHTVLERCVARDGRDFDYLVESIHPELLPLTDNTFLVVDNEHGVIIRLDENWNTKSKLLIKKVLIWDVDELEILSNGLADDDLQKWHDRILNKILDNKIRSK